MRLIDDIFQESVYRYSSGDLRNIRIETDTEERVICFYRRDEFLAEVHRVSYVFHSHYGRYQVLELFFYYRVFTLLQLLVPENT